MTDGDPGGVVRPAALCFLHRLLDPGSRRSWDGPVAEGSGPPGYAEQVAAARRRSGADESVLTGEGRLAGRRLAFAVGEFAFLGGSVGQEATRRLVAAIRRATREGLPLFAAPASGGTRMQEGTAAFVGMAAVAAALTEHRAAHLPYLVHLRHPCTGGVLASWGSLGQVTTAEPGALIGFLGPRVHEALHGEPFPAGVQRAENLHRVGIVDAVLSPDLLRDRLARTLALLASPGPHRLTDRPPAFDREAGRPPDPLPPTDHPPTPASPTDHRPDPDRTTDRSPNPDPPTDHPPAPDPPTDRSPHSVARHRGHGSAGPEARRIPVPAAVPGDPWESVLRTRAASWPSVRDLLASAAEFVELHGTGEGERDDAVVLGLARFADRSCVVAGHDRRAPRPVGPAGLRTARRGVRLAADWRLPLLTVVDTAGAELSPSAEEGALAGEIARCLADLSALRVPRVGLLLGQGAGGAAQALFAADRVVAAEHAWLAPLPPEGASAVVHRDTAHAARIAADQGITAPELHRRGLVHRLVPDGADLAARLAEAVAEELRGL
ncbi:carboxyl transferase domain-containing protein [Streptomyces mexicanus]|uniref:carboxyl transferase domain-containing protein n=1 Tax=Streptomyces mexicanus TaxID=178566 RepID=UPI0031EE75BC